LTDPVHHPDRIGIDPAAEEHVNYLILLRY
jgi:hypothetical protein